MCISLIIRSGAALVDNITKEEAKFENEKTEYRNERKILARNFKAEDVVQLQYIYNKLKIEKLLLHIKCSNKACLPRVYYYCF